MLFNKAYKLKGTEGPLLAVATAHKLMKGPADLPRSFWGVASSQTRDRDGDVIRQAGWDFTQYNKNAVGLWGHDYHLPPIFAVRDKKIEAGKLWTLNHFPEELGGLSDDVYRAFEAGVMNAFSVGFAPQAVMEDGALREEFGLSRDADFGNGILFWEQELFELSAVTVPSNPDAVASLKGFHQLKDMLGHADDYIIELTTTEDLPEGCDVIPDGHMEPGDDLGADDDTTWVRADDVETMKLILEDYGFKLYDTSTESVAELTIEWSDPEVVEAVLDLKPEPAQGESLDVADLNKVRCAVERIQAERAEAQERHRAKRVREAVEREMDYHRGKVRI